MYAKHSLDAIEQIVGAMPKLPALERYQAFATVKILGSELDEYATSHNLPHGTIRIILVDLYEALRAIAGLSDRGARDDSYYVSEALAAIRKLRMSQYFGDVAEA